MDDATSGQAGILVEPAVLTDIVRQALRREAATVIDWQAQPIHGGTGAVLGTSAVARVAGRARTGGEIVPWSVIRKALRRPDASAPPAIADPTRANYWQREVLTYRSDIIDELPDGLGAPRCFTIVEDAEQAQIWMEDLGDLNQAAWPVARFAVAARQLGRLGGVYLGGRSLPDHPWLLRSLLRERSDRNAPFWASLDQLRDHPRLQRGWPGDLADRASRLFDERHAFLDLLDRLPQTLQHGDAGRRNLRDGRLPDGPATGAAPASDPQTVAIDWGYTGVGPVGQEVAPLVVASAFWAGMGVDVADLPTLDRACFDAYVVGLQDSGWRGDRDVARLGYTVSVALRFGPLLGVTHLVGVTEEQRLQIEQAMGETIEQMLDRYAGVLRFALACADEARALAGSI